MIHWLLCNLLEYLLCVVILDISVMASNSNDDKVELHFISSCAPATVAGDEQLLINLQECRDINRPSEYKTWANKMITPLRDRLVYCIVGFCKIFKFDEFTDIVKSECLK